MIHQPKQYTTSSIDEIAEMRQELEKILQDKLRRKAAVIDKHGNVAMLMTYPTPNELDEDVKAVEVIVMDCAPEDEKDWMEILEGVWEVKPLDMTAGRQKYPELYL